jgi:hypothetical protein
MNVYKTKEGLFVGTKAEAGSDYEKLDIPSTSKPQMLEWLNENSNTVIGDTVDTNHTPSPDNSLGKCPKCKLTGGGAAKIAAGMQVDAIINRILNGGQGETIRLMEATIERCMEIKNGASD